MEVLTILEFISPILLHLTYIVRIFYVIHVVVVVFVYGKQAG